MLTFKKGDYTVNELAVLYNALVSARDSLFCDECGCDECENRKVCEDIARCRDYVRILVIKNRNRRR